MKIIFLDIDGVLNEAMTGSRTPLGFVGIDADKVRRLKSIIDATGAEIVLVSTWKEEWIPNRPDIEQSKDAVYMVEVLAKEGVHLMDRTYDCIRDRGNGITSWLSTHKDVDSFVILDDDIFPDYETLGLRPFHVKTSYGYGGLMDEHVSRAIQILNKGA